MYPPLRPSRSLLPERAENKATEFLVAWGWKIKMAGRPSLPAVKSLNLPLGRNHEAIQNRTAPGGARLLRRGPGHLFFSMRKLFFTEKTPGTPLAAMNARVASPLFGATPSSVTLPFLTMM